MSAGGHGPFWKQGPPGQRRPFWTKHSPWGRGGPWWLRPERGRGAAGPGSLHAAAGPGSLHAAASPAGGVAGWIMVRVAALFAIVVVLVAAVGLLLQHADSGPVAPRASSTGHDALWMGHAWVDGGRSPADLQRLAAHIRGSGIGDVYVFAGGLDRTGRLRPADYSGAGAFLRSFHSALPGVRVSAWLGGVTGGDHIDLRDASTRGHILAAAAAVLHAGFSGVHYDLEPVTSGDTGLLALLEATRGLDPHPLSLAVPKLEPLSGLRIPAGLIPGGPVFWSAGYLTQVARLVDQVAVMSYDTGMPFRSWYGGYVERETALALRAVPRGTTLLMGLPAYYDHTLSHHLGAETVAAAIHGIRVAVTRAGGGRGGRFGVALFADYSATPQDWASYQQDWVRPGQGPARPGSGPARVRRLCPAGSGTTRRHPPSGNTDGPSVFI
jgi:hypothetical protein